jgi:ParB-like chromosome segregation protein Spo0J|nr:MAG TPA: ParB protein [Caudoviricetes sp.]
MNIKVLDINSIKPSEFNPRIQLDVGSEEFQKIKESIIEFGLVEPLLVNEVNMSIIGGHQRYSVLKFLGYKEVPCVLINEPDEEREKALCVGLNKIKGEWDNDKLTALLNETGVNESITGFDKTEDDLNQYLVDEEDVDEEDVDEEDVDGGNTMIKVGHISFKISLYEYDCIITSIRKNGIFTPEAIRKELERRILND